MYGYELSMVIPCYNEEKNVKNVSLELVDELERNNINYELILVDNGSRDNTQGVIRELKKKNPRIKMVVVEKNQGYGWGITRGLEKARGRYVGILDGDNQISPRDVLNIFNKMRAERLDICKARRIVREDGLKRRMASLGYDMLLSLLFFRWIRDINSKPKLMKRECYRSLDIASKDWFIDTEIMVKSYGKKYKIGEFPVCFRKRRRGESNVNFNTIGEFLKNAVKFKFKNLCYR